MNVIRHLLSGLLGAILGPVLVWLGWEAFKARIRYVDRVLLEETKKAPIPENQDLFRDVGSRS